LAGYGAPLAVRYPYNWVEKENLITLTRTVVDPGVVREVICSPDRGLQIQLQQRIEPGFEHQVVYWRVGSPPRIVSSERITAMDPTLWQVEGEVADREGLVVAVAFAGVRLGAGWPADLEPLLNAPEGTVSRPGTTAALLRWMHLPVLSPAWLPTCSAWARRHGAEVLAAWLLDEGLPEGLYHSSTGEEWVAVVRQVFANWQPDSEQTRSIVEALAGDDLSHPLVSAARCLLRVDPLLLGRIVYTWLLSVGPFHSDRSASKVQIQHLRRQVAGLPEETSDADLRLRQEEILGEAAAAMGVDDRFLEAGIVQRAIGLFNEQTLSPVDAANLAVALGVAPFREYLGLRVLDEISHLL
jgi:hypothetical protein